MDRRNLDLYRTFLNGSLVVLAMTIMSCLISTMTVFMGGGQQGPDLHSLMLIQLASVPVAVALILCGIFLTPPNQKNRTVLKRIWSVLPQWMVFGFLLLNSLFIAGETAFLIVSKATDQAVTWTAHVPLVSMLACSIAFCVIFGSASLLAGKSSAMSGRW